ncbi:MAG: MBL fold metallo-hydrolase [Proteobacteria bacterium]|nr:MBL fold metallo-hydrolase [Pseudomonadota bacterium]
MEGFIKFLGTGGARFVAMKQLRSTGGLWLHYRDTNLYIDPGPGAIVKIHGSKERFDPVDLDGIILTHKHLDHANDVNIMIEAMTNGGFKKKGVLFCPEDAVDKDPVVLKYVMEYLDNIVYLKEQKSFTIKDISFSTPVRHVHPVETYGIIFHLNKTIGLISDTRFFDALPDHYHADILIINVLRSKPIEKQHIVDHLAINNVAEILGRIKPETAIMTHFGMNMIMEKPYLLAEKLKMETGINVIAAYDGMKLEF